MISGTGGRGDDAFGEGASPSSQFGNRLASSCRAGGRVASRIAQPNPFQFACPGRSLTRSGPVGRRQGGIVASVRPRKRVIALLAVLTLSALGTFTTTAQADGPGEGPGSGPQSGDGPTGSSFFIGNCITANHMTVAPDVIPFCGVARAAYNATGDVLTRHARFVGNDIRVMGGTLRISGGIWEGNRIIADKIVIQGNAIFVGNNRFIGNVYVEDIDSIANELDDLQACTDHFLSDYVATEHDGESALHPRETGIHTYNIAAASRIPVHDSFDYLHKRCGELLKENDYSYFSAVATARHPRANLTSNPVIRYDDLQAMSRELKSCRGKMRAAKNRSGAGPALRTLLNCSNAVVLDEL
ncbi:hypothetical protein [Kitasatospora sp. NPDC093558]|uniref:hypothetical protein n=1 Tax=Kitasatospora sp. NPDC093558 TaxID=3155201 RepID=UPI003448B270